LLPGARHKLNDPAVREVFVTDTVSVREQNSPQRHVISIAPLIVGALERFFVERQARRPVQSERAEPHG
jgi:phosphoribosylpyrophosphate synthetase